MSKKLHALHNEKVCNYLKSEPDFSDWVVTTAFYSALHHVQYEVFPLTRGLNNYHSFDNYYNRHFSTSKNKPNKHTATTKLAFAELGSDAGGHYKWLHDACRTARYSNFKVHARVADEAKNRLEELKSYLFKP